MGYFHLEVNNFQNQLVSELSTPGVILQRQRTNIRWCMEGISLELGSCVHKSGSVPMINGIN